MSAIGQSDVVSKYSLTELLVRVTALLDAHAGDKSAL